MSVDEKASLRNRINVLSVAIQSGEEQIKKIKRFSHFGRKVRRNLRQDKREFAQLLARYKELTSGKTFETPKQILQFSEKQKITDVYFENLKEQKEAIQEFYPNLTEKEAELFQQINRNKPFLPDLHWNDEAAIFAREFDYQIGKSMIGSEENKDLKSLFKKIEPLIGEEVNNPDNLHLRKLSRNQPSRHVDRSQEAPQIERAPQRSIKMPPM
ncbi:hypothetical protein ACNZ61_002806 [Enterococcus hirae]